MFSGIVKYLGFLFYLKYSFNFLFFFIKINSNNFSEIFIGDSLSIQGICLTLIYKNKNFLEFELYFFSSLYLILENNTILNIEKSIRLDSFINGNLVLSHINSFSFLFKNFFYKNNKLYFLISIIYKRYILYKNSLIIDGINFTINEIFYLKNNFFFIINLINFTNYNTNLNFLKIFSLVLIEFDLILYYILNIICI